MIDSHCHLNMLDLSAYEGDLAKLIEASKAKGVEQMLCVGVDLEHALEVIQIAERFPEVHASVGFHPGDEPNFILKPESLLKLAQHPKVVAIGETGLDYYYPDYNSEVQRERFRVHIEVAKQLKKPLIIHTREAQADTIAIMRENEANKVGGVMHCFTETMDMANEAMDLGFYISISGIVTFKKATNVQEVAKQIPLDRLLIETDAPYLAPVPFRGKQNEPQYVRYVAEAIAGLRNIRMAEVVAASTSNFKRLFLNM
ncbi:MAG TPA: TatD family hydrolase [Coxiellaceae bacterium]|nr:TatD family hydrolase [Coxiellaceae bacterium]